ncbi:MAG TPA: TetR family transcriptional regulator [Mycobacterium sp.]
MRVTKAQAEQNRAHIVATDARLFRECGYDGVGVAELVAAAGFTHGGFYRHFRSKADASANGLSRTVARTEALDIAESYVSREHRDGRSEGCAIAALGGDAACQPEDIKPEFAADVLAHSVGVIMLSRACLDGSPPADERLAVCREAILASLAAGDGRPAAESLASRS